MDSTHTPPTKKKKDHKPHGFGADVSGLDLWANDDRVRMVGFGADVNGLDLWANDDRVRMVGFGANVNGLDLWASADRVRMVRRGYYLSKLASACPEVD